MNVRTAILMAADHIEKNPSIFDFDNVRVPGCGTPGCALGWIGHFSGLAEGTTIQELFRVLGVNDEQFYYRMNTVDGAYTPMWTRDAKHCATLLRLYADKFHPATVEHVGIPASVRAIFAESVAA